MSIKSVPYKTTIVVMCGGRGSRLGQLTEMIPKPLVKLSGKTILELKLEHYTNQSYFNTILCVGYQSEKIKTLIKPKFNKVRFHDSGLQAGILRRLSDIRDQLLPIILVSYGDTFANLNLDELLKNHLKNNVLITLVVAPVTNPFGIIQRDAQNFITSFEEKPVLNHFIGYFVISREAIDYIPKNVIEMPDGEGIVRMFQILITLKQAKVYEFTGLKFTINTRSELDDARKIVGEYFTLEDSGNE